MSSCVLPLCRTSLSTAIAATSCTRLAQRNTRSAAHSAPISSFSSWPAGTASSRRHWRCILSSRTATLQHKFSSLQLNTRICVAQTTSSSDGRTSRRPVSTRTTSFDPFARLRRVTLPLVAATRPAVVMNGETSAKRKRSSVAAPAERPAKHLRPEVSSLTPGDTTPANGTVYDIEDEEEAGRLLPLGPAQADSPEWQATIERVVKSVVSIHFCQTCSFDTDLSMSSQATGFVVDAERGYILTNRHVACAGPFWGYCIFDNHEEVSSAAIRRFCGACFDKIRDANLFSWLSSVMFVRFIETRCTTSVSSSSIRLQSNT